MKRLVIIIALLLLAAPLSVPNATASNWIQAQVRATRELHKWNKHQANFWKKFNADMAGIDKDLNTPFFKTTQTQTTSSTRSHANIVRR